MGSTGIFCSPLASCSGEAARALLGGPAGRERISGRAGEIEHAAALHAIGRAEGTAREDVAGEVTVVARIGIEDAADGAVFVRQRRLDAAPGDAVAHDHDLAFHVDALRAQVFVILRQAVVGIDERRGDIAGGGEGVVGRKLAAFVRILVAGDGGLFQASPGLCAARSFPDCARWGWAAGLRTLRRARSGPRSGAGRRCSRPRPWSRPSRHDAGARPYVPGIGGSARAGSRRGPCLPRCARRAGNRGESRGYRGRRRRGVRRRERKDPAALSYRTSGDDFPSIIAGMDFRTHYEEFKVQAKDLVEKVHSLVREGNIRRIIIKDEKGNTFIEIPLTVGVVTALAVPVLAGLGAIAALVANFTIGVERTEARPSRADAQAGGGGAVHRARATIAGCGPSSPRVSCCGCTRRRAGHAGGAIPEPGAQPLHAASRRVPRRLRDSALARTPGARA